MAEDKKNSKPTDDKNVNTAGDGDTKQTDNDTTKDGDTIPKKSYEVVADKLRKANAKLEKIEKEREEAEQKKLEEQGEYKKLAEQKEQEAEQAKAELAKAKKLNALHLEAVKNGAVDPDDVTKFVDLDSIELSEDGSIDMSTVSSAISTLKESKDYLFGEKSKKTIGADGGAPNGDDTKMHTFKRSQLRDSKFYEEHEAEILKAGAEGRIIDDITPQASK